MEFILVNRDGIDAVMLMRDLAWENKGCQKKVAGIEVYNISGNAKDEENFKEPNQNGGKNMVSENFDLRGLGSK